MPIPHASNRNFTTLNHLYALPPTHRRDFVRENKQNVRDNNRNRQQIKTKIQELPNSSSGEEIHSSQSSAQRFYVAGKGPMPQAQVETQQKTKSHPVIQTTNSRYMPKWQYPAKTRNLEQHKEPWTYGREAADRTVQQKLNKNAQTAVQQKRTTSGTKTKATKAITATKAIATIKTSNIGIQTDEIQDEIYLYNALKKCASPAFKSALKSKYLQKEQTSKSSGTTDFNDELKLQWDNSPRFHDSEIDDIDESHQVTPRQCGGASHPLTTTATNTTIIPQRNASAQTVTTEASHSKFDHESARLYAPYGNDAVNTARHQNDATLNAMTTFPSDTKNLCSPSKCHNCPIGYHLLGEEERTQLRTKLLAHEALLIKQLNSFPLAIETLRVRQSKTRIEKELSILEQNLRKLTKKKVYAKIHE